MIRNNTERLTHYDNSLYTRTKEKVEKERSNNRFEKKQEDIQVNDRLSQIQEQIQNGSYKIDLKKTSEKVVLNLLNL